MILVRDWIMAIEDEVGDVSGLEPWEKRVLFSASTMWTSAAGNTGLLVVGCVTASMSFFKATVVCGEIVASFMADKVRMLRMEKGLDGTFEWVKRSF